MASRYHPTNLKFAPTPESIPPAGASLRLKQSTAVPVNSQTLNPLVFLLRATLIYPDKLALIHPNVPSPVAYTYRIWAQRVQNLAYSLLQNGIKPGDRVAVLAPNTPLIADAHHGIIAVGAVLVPMNTRLKPDEISYILEHSGSKLILVDHEFSHLVNGSKAPVIVSHDTGRSSDPYEQFLSAGRNFSQEKGWEGLPVISDENAPAVLCYTSGTTGRPKGVITTLRGSYLAAIANAYEAQLTYDSVYLWILPMFHAAGWTFPWTITFAFATQITLRTVEYPAIWSHFLGSGVTHYCGAPTVQIGIVNDPSAKPTPQKIKAIIAGAAPTASLIESLERKGITPVHVYGLTETYGPFTRNYSRSTWTSLSPAERARFMARQGHAFSTAQEARVVYQLGEDNNDTNVVLKDVPKDGKTVGEIVTRGNIVMKEYYRDPEATAKAFRGGYFHSGDLAVMYPDGAVSIVDRSKDLIISGGENASSLAIETELASHPHVLEVAVVARPHPKWGERPMAYVALRPDHKTCERIPEGFTKSLMEHARKRLPGFACPEWVEIVQELPKTSTGKIVKTELRKMAAKL